jgi:hypothetical protein
MPLVNGCAFPLKKVKASTFAIAAQLNPRASEKIDAATLHGEQNKKHCSPYLLSLKSKTHAATLSSIQADPTKLASKEEGILTFGVMKPEVTWVWLHPSSIHPLFAACVQTLLRAASSKEASLLQGLLDLSRREENE